MTTWDQTQEILLYLSRLNPAMKIVSGMTDAWHDQLQEFDAGEVQAAARLVGGRQTWVGVAELRTACKLARRERIRAAGNIHALVQADRDDVAACHREYQTLVAEIASGRRSPAGELETGR